MQRYEGANAPRCGALEQLLGTRRMQEPSWHPRIYMSYVAARGVSQRHSVIQRHVVEQNTAAGVGIPPPGPRLTETRPDLSRTTTVDF
jgi:hypothetical protein